MAETSKRPELFETVLVGDEFAVGVVSIPRSELPRPNEASTAEALIEQLGLVPHVRMSSEALRQALTALVINETVDDVVTWLAEPPNQVEFEWQLPPPVMKQEREYRAPDYEEAERKLVLPPQAPSGSPPRLRRKIPKDSPDAASIEFAIADIAADAVVPFARSPVDITALSELLQGAVQLTAWVVSPRTNPFLLLEMPAGYLLVRAVQGVGQGIRRGLSDGVYYRLLQLFKVPDDWRRP